MEIKWGMIGAGDVTEVKSGPAFSKVPNSTLVAAMRRDKDKLEDYVRRHRIPKAYTSVDEMMADDKINAIYIATPPNMHLNYAKKAILAGKMVYIEKPVTMTVSEAEELIAMKNSCKAKVVAAHYRRQLPYFRQIYQIISSGAIGDVQVVQSQSSKIYNKNGNADGWRNNPAISGGGIFHDLAPHQIDLLLKWFGTPKQYNALSNYSHDKGYADRISGQVLFSDSVIFNGLWNFDASENSDHAVIFGSEGKLEFSFFDMGHFAVWKNGEQQKVEIPHEQHVQQPMIAEVVRFFRDERENPCDIETALDGLKLIEYFSKA